MASSAWGSVTNTQTAAGGGGGDPHVLQLKEHNRIRIVDAAPRVWRTHTVHGLDGKPRFIVCPKGAGGTGSSDCPLCMKPVQMTEDGQIRQQFPISRRFATNVFDYDSGAVKVMIGGPQIFKAIDAVAQAGLDPLQSDFHITKSGTGVNTNYAVVRGGTDPLPVTIDPSDLHELDKYDTAPSVEHIFKTLEEAGIDYDALQVPDIPFDSAEAMPMPYGKYKGTPIGELWRMDSDYMHYLYGVKRSENVMDSVMLAMHSVLLHHGEVDPLPVHGNGKSVSRSAAPAPDEPVRTDSAQPELVTLWGPDGEIQVPEPAVESLLATGFTREPLKQQETGIPADDTQVRFFLNVTKTEVDMAFKDAKRLAAQNEGHFVDPELAASLADDAQEDKALAADLAGKLDDPDPINEDPLDSSHASQRDDERWVHPALEGKDYATKGAVTAALNRLKKQNDGDSDESDGDGDPAEDGDGSKLFAECRDLIQQVPGLLADFAELKKLLDTATGGRTRKLPDMQEDELRKLRDLLTERLAQD